MYTYDDFVIFSLNVLYIYVYIYMYMYINIYTGGYMVMYFRKTVQTRNTDLLFVKVFCPDNERHSKEHTRHGPDQSENNSTK
jgi:hypothetical protein